MNSIYFTEDHQLFRESFRDFLQKEVVPHIEKWEKEGTIERFIWKKFGDMGFFGLNYPEAYGGSNLDLFYTVIFLEELQKIKSSGFAAAMWAHAYLAMTHLNAEGDERIKEEYLASSIAGDKIGALCITEPFGGSDVAGMRTTAERKGNKFVINGSKTFITNGVYADYYVVAAKTDPTLGNKGISIFLIDAKTPGISATKLNKLGWKASDTAELAFDNVEIPLENLMGEEGKGFPYIMQHFALERLIMAINAHARAEYAIDYTLGYMSEREAFGKTINKFQALRHTIVEHTTEVEHCKLFNYAAVSRLNKGEYVVKEATMAKLKSTKVADLAIYDCLQMLGGYGYMEEYPLARLLRDSRLGPIGGGTSEILKEILSKMIIDNKDYQPAVK
ncbi:MULTISPECIES: acyl-CoA dehydrogenase family protein [Flavobacterium]|uniref:Acyl-CoA dehydrogenase family protein n=1 Tax=Flavobacterium covae TaxID=2906076 RepID=A0ABW8PF99_9FLAO|nr:MULTISPECIES: acyl-CoA dehydrogenase family protein [Flavobacterium]OXA80692.1 acyl-CoA dehydrogenase [Flavobacterium columnare] [Flavobacterium columnare NBRC 100251 = ATCC 23463]AMA49631.1 acyl-CoA dehydrogenase [Flavobacterium covae]MCJ1809511.1 acyl-CoA dehydrogenase family protein [Flavobacterium covae]OWP82049.1 acyl-CoA dehydrogenase [Flavobacterium covae]OWP87717.1 acyl-CoA dehydrogenase [Flavobacterium covae]